MTTIKGIYGLLVGILLLMLVAFGVSAFSDAPALWGAESYYRNVLLIACSIGLVFTAAGLALPSRMNVIRGGLMGGGFGTMMYGLIYPTTVSFGASSEWAFGTIAVVLAILSPLGYWALVMRKNGNSSDVKEENDQS